MGGSVKNTIIRTVAAVATQGASELIRSKPFQPGSGGKGEADLALRSLVGVGTVGKGLAVANELSRDKPYQSAGDKMDTGNVINATGVGILKKTDVLSDAGPPPIDTSAIDVANKQKEAANAVQTADAEARRARSAKRQSSVLGSYQAKSQINASTLQPAQPRRSVLG